MTDRAPKPIVILDDNQDDLDLAQIVFEMTDMPVSLVTCARSGELLSTLNEQGAAVVLLDLNLGTESGIDVLRRVRRLQGDVGQTPVVMLSHSDEPGHVQRAKQAGAQEYVSKPDNVEALQSFFRRLAEEYC